MTTNSTATALVQTTMPKAFASCLGAIAVQHGYLTASDLVRAAVVAHVRELEAQNAYLK